MCLIHLCAWEVVSWSVSAMACEYWKLERLGSGRATLIGCDRVAAHAMGRLQQRWFQTLSCAYGEIMSHGAPLLCTTAASPKCCLTHKTVENTNPGPLQASELGQPSCPIPRLGRPCTYPPARKCSILGHYACLCGQWPAQWAVQRQRVAPALPTPCSYQHNSTRREE